MARRKKAGSPAVVLSYVSGVVRNYPLANARLMIMADYTETPTSRLVEKLINDAYGLFRERAINENAARLMALELIHNVDKHQAQEKSNGTNK